MMVVEKMSSGLMKTPIVLSMLMKMILVVT